MAGFVRRRIEKLAMQNAFATGAKIRFSEKSILVLGTL